MIILRDYIVSAASQLNAGGGSNGDNPTNLGVSDFSIVAATLDTNNARFIGVVKPVLIDLKLPLGQQGASSESVQPERLNKLAA